MLYFTGAVRLLDPTVYMKSVLYTFRSQMLSTAFFLRCMKKKVSPPLYSLVCSVNDKLLFLYFLFPFAGYLWMWIIFKSRRSFNGWEISNFEGWLLRIHKQDCTYWHFGGGQEVEAAALAEVFQLLIAYVIRKTGLIFMALSAITNSS